MWIADKWTDYEVLDTSFGEKLERWGTYILRRPDPQIIWNTKKEHPLWEKADAKYIRSSTGGGAWEKYSIPDSWQISYRELHFNLKPMNFKHTGLFPEQAVNWDFCADKIKNAGRPISVLNLFAYTGGATAACLKAGAEVCHVDAARGMVDWAKENMQASGLADCSIRYMVDDCQKFVLREARRGKRYDGIIMDPPSFGRGPNKEVWKLEDKLYDLLLSCRDVLSERPLFFILNSYTTGLSPAVMKYMLEAVIKKQFGGSCTADEIGLPVTETGGILPCGNTARWENDKD